MGVQHKFGTAGATGGGWSAQPGTLQPGYEESWHTPYWSWQARSPMTRRDKMNWRSKWSFGCKVGYGDVSGADGATAGDMTLQDWYNPPSVPDGNQGLKFIKGMCVDTSDAPLSGVNVQAFRTSDNSPASSNYTIQSRTDGSYDVPTPYVGVNHFVAAYLAGSPDRTAHTLNTLVPTNIDGT